MQLTTRAAPSGWSRPSVAGSGRHPLVTSSSSDRSFTAPGQPAPTSTRARVTNPFLPRAGGLRRAPPDPPAARWPPPRASRAGAWARSASSPAIRCTLSFALSRPSWARGRSFAASGCPFSRPETGPADWSTAPPRRGSVARRADPATAWPTVRNPSGKHVRRGYRGVGADPVGAQHLRLCGLRHNASFRPLTAVRRTGWSASSTSSDAAPAVDRDPAEPPPGDRVVTSDTSIRTPAGTGT